MSIPITPKRNAREDSPPGLHSILRSKDSCQTPYSNEKPEKTPQSQVRFEIPQQEDWTPQEDSPSKIVFPNSSAAGLDNHGHFVDMHTGVMLDVPEDIWKFHTSRKAHSRQKSLQSIIADTLASINSTQKDPSTPASVQSTIGHVSPLKIRRNSQLYLAPESPVNTYKIPVPLQISVPPFLSPQNKQKKRSSLLFDGNGYSEYNQEEFEDDSGTISDRKSNSIEEADGSEISTNSLPSAEHDLSLNIADGHLNFENVLGIDEDANVNLKLQKKNLKKNQSPTRPGADRESLRILATPSKLIQIPNLSNQNLPKTSNGSLSFFDNMVRSETEPQYDSVNSEKERDKLDLGFVFPKPSRDNNDQDFLKVDTSPVSKEFEHRRDKLMKENLSPSNIKRHNHRRSRSIHQIEDMFTATSTPPRIPERSSLRLQSSHSSSPKALPNGVPPSERKHVNSKGCEEVSDASEETSSLYEETAGAPKIQVDDVAATSAGETVLISQDKHSNNVERQRGGNLADPDKSIELLFERVISNCENSHNERVDSKDGEFTRLEKPLSSMQSFRDGVIPAHCDNITSSSEFINRDGYLNLLSPRRSLSNVGSNSSHNSQFSKRTLQSNTTSTFDSVMLKNFECNYSKSQKPNDVRSIYEKREGKTVEVIVIDEEEEVIDSVQKPNSRMELLSSSGEASQKCKEILQMCEQTATQAKDLILQLIEEEPRERNGLRSSNSPRKFVTLQSFTQYSTPPRTLATVQKSNQPYVSKLNRAMKVRPA